MAGNADSARSRTPPRGPSGNPPRWRKRSRIREGGRELVVQERVVREATSTVVYPMLTTTNYTEWALVMRVNLRAQGLWHAIDPGVADDRVDMSALSAILRAVPPEMLSGLAVKDTAKEAWDAVKMMRVGVDRVREANAQKLRMEFESIAFKDGEMIDAFSMRITGIVNNLRTLGDTLEDEKVVKKFLRVVPPRFTQVAIAIETLLELRTLSIEELTGRLRSVEERYGLGDIGETGGSRLLLTEEEWLAHMKNRKKKSTFNIRKVRCYNCQDYGHFSRDCTAPRKEQAHLAAADTDDEPALL